MDIIGVMLTAGEREHEMLSAECERAYYGVLAEDASRHSADLDYSAREAAKDAMTGIA